MQSEINGIVHVKQGVPLASWKTESHRITIVWSHKGPSHHLLSQHLIGELWKHLGDPHDGQMDIQDRGSQPFFSDVPPSAPPTDLWWEPFWSECDFLNCSRWKDSSFGWTSLQQLRPRLLCFSCDWQVMKGGVCQVGWKHPAVGELFRIIKLDCVLNIKFSLWISTYWIFLK